MGSLEDTEVACGAGASGELGLIALPLSPCLPAFASAPDEDPAAAVGGLVAEETTRSIHRGCLEPVGSVLSGRVLLLDFPA